MAKKTDDTNEPAKNVVELDTLAKAFTEALKTIKPIEKKTVATRRKGTAWTPKDGAPKLKMRRKMFHHGVELTTKISNEEIELLNKVKPGSYCEGWVRVILRKDKGIDIDYPVKTSSQRLKLPNQFSITSFSSLLRRLIDEAANPASYRKPEDEDLYDLNSN